MTGKTCFCLAEFFHTYTGFKKKQPLPYCLQPVDQTRKTFFSFQLASFIWTSLIFICATVQMQVLMTVNPSPQDNAEYTAII